MGYVITYYRTINRTELRYSVPDPDSEQLEFYDEHDIFIVSGSDNGTVLGYDLYM